MESLSVRTSRATRLIHPYGACLSSDESPLILKPVSSVLSRALWASHRPSQRVSLQLDVDTSDDISTCSRLPHFVREGSPASLIPMVSYQHPNSRHPPRLNGAILLAFLHTALASRIDECTDEFPRVMLSAVDAVLARCNSISDANLVFSDHQPTLAESHPLHTFIQWPDRQAGRGRDFSSAHTSLLACL